MIIFYSTVANDQRLENAMERLYLTNKEIILLGDININYLDENERKHRLIKTFSNLGLHQLINEITRPASQSCLDHVYTTHPQHVFKTKVYESGMSDHLPVCVVRKYQKRQKQSQHHTITYRDCKNFDEQAFLRDLNSAPWCTMEMFDAQGGYSGI